MPATREARYLSGVDIGKHVRLMVPGGKHTGPWEIEGKLVGATHFGDGAVSMIVLRATGGPRQVGYLPPETPVTITGKAS
ncbi:hypothetical protein BLJ79_04215 [Arthrobacter sp. UCD-GKA]|uniref:hypothetical protein n=1 Tax=Arthrobacter sp. UCD-GKA TaxID=1913576 RepID=UPI0008DE3A4A|nr:hypothetical protein [Arthrobacter sp. UCD-GKA]OIH86006.1 hypothetical protein BLJ79_04215 [Arthrobacter sp. UCD-GKA]